MPGRVREMRSLPAQPHHALSLCLGVILPLPVQPAERLLEALALDLVLLLLRLEDGRPCLARGR